MNEIRECFLQLASTDDSRSYGGFIITEESQIIRSLQPDLQTEIRSIPTAYRPHFPEYYRTWIRDNLLQNIDTIQRPTFNLKYDKFIYKTLTLL